MTLRELYLEVQKQNPKALDYTLLVQDYEYNTQYEPNIQILNQAKETIVLKQVR